MPAVGNPIMYKHLIDYRATTSVLKQTVSTLQKRQSALALRCTLSSKKVLRSSKRKQKILPIRKNVFKSVDIGYLPNTIADWEEKDRIMMMASREFLVIPLFVVLFFEF